MKGITYVGIDAHKEKLFVAVLSPEGPVVETSVPNTEKHIAQLAKKLHRKAEDAEVRACYEAGPTGYGLKRQLEAKGIICEIIAPALIPRAPGDRVKTDRRDARRLAELLRADMLTEVRAPTPAEEAIRELCRARLRAAEQSTRAKNRLGKMLLRHGLSFGGKPWSQAFRTWLGTLTFDEEGTRLVFEDLRAECEHAEERVRRLEAHIKRFAEKEPYAKVVGALCCLRGVQTLTAMVMISELHGFERFKTPRALMAYLGLTPSEHSSGGVEKRGAITKAGNQFARRLLVEAAHHARRDVKTSRALRLRRKDQPAHIVAIAERAQSRLHRRYWRLVGRGKASNKAVVAVARELAGFIWSLMSEVYLQPAVAR